MDIEITIQGQFGKNLSKGVISLDDGSVIEIKEREYPDIGKFVVICIKAKSRCSIDIDRG